jgi:hypothetical protein
VNRRTIVGLGLVVILIAVVVVLRGAAPSDSPDHSSASDAGDGSSALRYYAQALGHTTSTIEGSFTLPSAPSLLFLFTPSDGFGYSMSEGQQLNRWVASGNVLVYAAEMGDPVVDTQFGLHRSRNPVDANAMAAAPILGGVNSLSGAQQALAFTASPAQVPLVRNRTGDVLGVRMVVGTGQLIALTDPLVLCNGYLKLADNGRLAADLIALASNGGPVLFDEYHHGQVAGGSPTAIAWVATPWGAALALMVVIVFGGLALRGRTFGPPIPLQTRADRSSAEYAAAVGGLLRRTGARTVTLETLLAATRRAVAQRVGLGSGTPDSELIETIRQRAPGAASELVRAEADLAQAAGSETEVLAMARRLHELAYPLAPIDSKKEIA